MKKSIALVIALIILSLSCFVTASAAETQKYKLSFDTNDVQKIEDQWYSENEDISLPKGKADGYMFIGWYTNEEFTELFTLEKMPAKNIKVYGLYAVALSKLANEFKDVNIEKAVSDIGITPEEFNKIAKEYGLEIVYSIGGKQYEVTDIVNYMDEISNKVNSVIEKGETTGMNVTVKLGKNDIGKTYTFNIYNDLVSNSKKTSTTTVKTDDNTVNTEKETSQTRSKFIVPIMLILFVGISLAVILWKRQQYGKQN